MTYQAERIIAIVNPAARRGRSAQRWEEVCHRLEGRGLHVETCATTAPGHATALTRTAIEHGFSTVVAVGGDGTVHEVVNGFMNRQGLAQTARLAVVPAGTGMDFARNVGCERGVGDAVHRLLRGRERRVDVGRVIDGEDHVFVNFAEMGIGARVVAKESGIQAPLPGRASFFLAALATVAERADFGGRVVVDGKQVYSGPVVSVAVANGQYFGGGMKIAPHARVDDGLLDVVVLGDFTRTELITQIWKIYPGRHVSHPKVRVARGKQVDVEMEGHSSLDLDGELYGPIARRFDLLPRALRVVV